MKVHIVCFDMNRQIDRVFRYKKHAIQYAKDTGYSKKSGSFYVNPDVEEQEIEEHDTVSIETREVF